MIEDLDSSDAGSSGAPIVRAISLALVIASAIGWAALQQPVLRGPYATPDPSGGVTFIERASPSPSLSVLRAWQPVIAATTISCVLGQSQQLRTGYGFVGDHSVTLVRQLDVNVWTSGAGCQHETATPAWRFAP